MQNLMTGCLLWQPIIVAMDVSGRQLKEQRVKIFGTCNILPEETRNHVKKFIATHLIFEGAGGFTTMTAAEVAQAKAQNKNTPLTLSAAELAGSALIEVSGRFNSLVVANELQINIQQFNAWNPGFDKALAAGEKYAMRISKEKEAIFLAKKNQLLLASVRAIIEGVNQ